MQGIEYNTGTYPKEEECEMPKKNTRRMKRLAMRRRKRRKMKK
jgi:hypothetical protein